MPQETRLYDEGEVRFMHDRQAGTYAETLAALFQGGFVAIPHLLFRYYRRIGLTDSELLLLLHIAAFRDGDHNEFPTFRDLADRLSLPEDTVARQVQHLIENGCLRIDVRRQTNRGQVVESYDLSPLYYRLAELSQDPDRNVFLAFEKEWGRTLTSIQYEQIVQWMDRDHHSEELILAALREAVLAGAHNFKYIDRVLFDWQQNNVRTPQDVERYKARRRVHQEQAAATEPSSTRKPRAKGSAAPAPSSKYDAFYQKMPPSNPR